MATVETRNARDSTKLPHPKRKVAEIVGIDQEGSEKSVPASDSLSLNSASGLASPGRRRSSCKAVSLPWPKGDKGSFGS